MKKYLPLSLLFLLLPLGVYAATTGLGKNGNSEYLLYSSDNLGIGTQAPSYKLDVQGNVSFDSGNITSDGSGGFTANSGIFNSSLTADNMGATGGGAGSQFEFTAGHTGVTIDGMLVTDNGNIFTDGSGNLTVSSCTGCGGSQSPWVSDIDAVQFSLSDQTNSNGVSFILHGQDGGTYGTMGGLFQPDDLPMATWDSSNSSYNFANFGIIANGVGVRIGDGVPATTYPLEVAGSVNITGDYLCNGSLCSGAGSQWTDSGSSIYFNTGNVGMGTTTPGTLLSLGNTGNNTSNFSITSTSTLGTGINLRSGCFAVNSVCVTGGGGANAGIFGQATFYGANGSTVSGTTTLVFGTTTADRNNIGIGSTSPLGELSLGANTATVPAIAFTATNASVLATPINGTFEMDSSFIPYWTIGGVQEKLMYNPGCGNNTIPFLSSTNGAYNCTSVFNFVAGTNLLTTGGLNTSGSGKVAVASSTPWADFSADSNGNNTNLIALGSSTNRYSYLVMNSQANLGLGTTSPYALLSVVASTTLTNVKMLAAFATSTNAQNEMWRLSNTGVVDTGGDTPTVNGVGNTITGDNTQGAITTGTTITAVTVTFSDGGYVTGGTMSCQVSDDSATSVPYVSAISNTAFTVTLTVALTGGKIYYHCGHSLK